jgi:hypothetical protein
MSLLKVAAFPTFLEVTGTNCPSCGHIGNQKADVRRHCLKGCTCAQPIWYQGKKHDPFILMHAEGSGEKLRAAFAAGLVSLMA